MNEHTTNVTIVICITVFLCTIIAAAVYYNLSVSREAIRAGLVQAPLPGGAGTMWTKPTP